MPKQDLDWDKDDWPRKRSRQREDEDDDDDRPLKRKRRVRSQRPSSLPLVIGLLFGGLLLLLLAGGVVGAMFLWKGGVPGGAPGVVNNPLGIPAGGPPAVVRPPLPPGWVDFKHPDCNMSIYCPGGHPVPNEYTTDQPLGSPLAPGYANTKRYHTTGTPLSCGFGVSEMPSLSPAIREHKQRDTFVLKNAVTREVVWNGRPSTEVAGDSTLSPGTKSVSRRFWVGDRFYSATLFCKDRHPTDAEQAAFFGSFVLGE